MPQVTKDYILSGGYFENRRVNLMIRRVKQEDAAEIGRISREVLGHPDAEDEIIARRIESLSIDESYFIFGILQ